MDTFKEIKNEKFNSFLFTPATLLNYIKNIHQTSACKIRAKYKEKQKLIKSKSGFQQNQGKSQPRETKETETKHRNKIRKEMRALQVKGRT